MVFSSLVFLCAFLPAVVLLYFGLPKSLNNIILVAASLVFYGWGDPVALLLVAASVALNFHLGGLIDHCVGRRRRQLIVVAVALNLIGLGVFKYANFIVDNVNVVLALFGATALRSPGIALPLGISFFTFHVISYLVDVYRGNARAQRSLAAFTLYIVNFPQLIAGPIIRYRQISDQLDARATHLGDVEAGVVRFCAGLAKKLLIANPIGEIADWVFAIAPGELSVATAWFGIACYALQIYFDFSGYSDMAIGLARMFGFRFPENFNYPYAATSIQDFWRRWHMTLSAWFRDYVYIPLGGNRLGPWKTVRNLWLVFFLTGIWHGASWNFVVWGLWHGLFLSLERLAPVARALGRAPAVVGNAYTLLVVLIGWVFFRSPTLDHALAYLGRMFGLWSADFATVSVLTLVGIPMLALIGVACCLAMPLWPRLRKMFERATGDGLARVAGDLARAAFVAGVAVVSLATLVVERANPFIYFRF